MENLLNGKQIKNFHIHKFLLNMMVILILWVDRIILFLYVKVETLFFQKYMNKDYFKNKLYDTLVDNPFKPGKEIHNLVN